MAKIRYFTPIKMDKTSSILIEEVEVEAMIAGILKGNIIML